MNVCMSEWMNGWVTRGGSRTFPPGGVRWDTVPQRRRRRLRGRYGGGFLNMKCCRSDSEQTSGTLEIFSRAIFLGTLLQFCENSEERVQSQIINFMVWIFMGSNLSWRGVLGSRKLRNMKCSRSDFRPIEGTLSNSKFYGVNIDG